jgi:hypothetical protein
VLGAIASNTPSTQSRPKPRRAVVLGAGTPGEATQASGPGPEGRFDGALTHAEDVVAGAVTAGTGNALLAPLFVFALALLGLAALAPAIAGARLRPLIDRRGQVAAAGLACLVAWAVVIIGA